MLLRFVSRQRIPGVLQLAVAGLTVRTIVGLLGGTFMYFLQPVATTLALSLVFLASLWWGQPLIARMASDFCPLESEISGRPAVVRLFSGLTLMWAAMHLLSAGTTFAPAGQPADHDVRGGEDCREPRDHHERDRVDRFVGVADRPCGNLVFAPVVT